MHEQRLDSIEAALKELSKTMRDFERMANKAIGGFAVILCLQPIVTGVIIGVVVHFITRK